MCHLGDQIIAECLTVLQWRHRVTMLTVIVLDVTQYDRKESLRATTNNFKLLCISMSMWITDSECQARLVPSKFAGTFL